MIFVIITTLNRLHSCDYNKWRLPIFTRLQLSTLINTVIKEHYFIFSIELTIEFTANSRKSTNKLYNRFKYILAYIYKITEILPAYNIL